LGTEAVAGDAVDAGFAATVGAVDGVTVPNCGTEAVAPGRIGDAEVVAAGIGEVVEICTAFASGATAADVIGTTGAALTSGAAGAVVGGRGGWTGSTCACRGPFGGTG